MIVYPRLPRKAAREMVERLRAGDPTELREHAALEHPAMTYSPVGTRAPLESIRSVRDQVRRLADESGFPAAPGTDPRQRFAGECGALLHRTMNIPSNDAASEDVWAFLTCVVLPDVAAWRFQQPAEIRLLGGRRNTFRRVWERARALVDLDAHDPYWLLRALNEDEVVQIMERPTLGANRDVARAMARAFVTSLDEVGAVRRMALMRDAAKRLIRLTPFLSLDILPAEQLDAVMAGIFSDSVAALSGVKRTTGVAATELSGNGTRSAAEQPADADGSAAETAPSGPGRRPRTEEDRRQIREFAQRLVAVRTSRGMTHQELADASGISAGSLRAYEEDGRYPHRPQREAIARALGVAVDWLEG